MCIRDSSRRIDTFEISIQPYEDCCTVFTPKHPKTRPQLDAVEKAQALIPLEELMERALAGVKIVPIDALVHSLSCSLKEVLCNES